MEVGDVVTAVDDRARCRRKESREQVENGRFTGAIWADQSVNGTAADPQVDAVDCHKPVKLLRELAGLEDRVVRHAIVRVVIGYGTVNGCRNQKTEPQRNNPIYGAAGPGVPSWGGFFLRPPFRPRFFLRMAACPPRSPVAGL